MGKRLPIYNISEKAFCDFRGKYLDKRDLSDEAISEIEKLFDADPKTTETVHVNCDEAHTHEYDCLGFGNKSTAVIVRLLTEIRYPSRRRGR